MGLSLVANYKNAPRYYAGYSTFYRLRMNVAKAVLGDEFYKYETWLKTDDNTPQEELHKICKAIIDVSPSFEQRKDFINLLKGCYSHRAYLRWY